MKKLLFIDDDPQLLEGLRDGLRRYRREWQCSFACGGEAGLALLQGDTFDAVVTDARMPGVMGLDVLRAAQHHSPAALRVVLSGQIDLLTIGHLMELAHRVVGKPCELTRLHEVIEQALTERSDVATTGVAKLVTEARTLPSLSASIAELTAALADPDVQVAATTALIERDPGLTARVLRLANSPYFGSSRRVASPANAASQLGVELLRTLVRSAELLQSDLTPTPWLTGELPWRAGRLARALAPEGPVAEMAFTAGILMNTGQLLLARDHADVWARLVAEAGKSCASITVLERAHFGFTHAELGAALLSTWGLPQEVVEAIHDHHTPPAEWSAPLKARHYLYVAAAHLDGAPPPGASAPPELLALARRAASMDPSTP